MSAEKRLKSIATSKPNAEALNGLQKIAEFLLEAYLGKTERRVVRS